MPLASIHSVAGPGPVVAEAAPVAPRRRFTIDGSDELEESLEERCREVLDGVRQYVPESMLEGVLLGGGYGRGEGGVLRGESGDLPYNDLDFYLFLRGRAFLNQRRFGARLETLAGRLGARSGLEIEFKILSRAAFRRSAPSMYYYDLTAGHRVLWAGKDLMRGCEHHLQEERIPAEEASRLLMNRCAGLLFAGERLDRRPFLAEDADFVWRNLAKAQLAFGDAVLALRGLYHWSCLERHNRLRRLVDSDGLPGLETLLKHHAEGVSFKLHPRRFVGSRFELTAKHESVARFALAVWLWVENRRLGRAFESAEEYTDRKTNKLPRTGALRNWFATGVKCGPTHCFSSAGFRHPRERVLHWLTFLLWPPAAEGEGALRDRARAELGAVSANRPELIRAFTSLWRRCS